MVDNNNVELNSTDLKQCLEDFCSKIGNEDFSQNQKEFSQLWKNYVNEKGYDDFAEKVLIETYQFSSVNYWKDLWKKACDIGQGDDFFKKFLSGKMIKNKGRGQLMVTLGVLSICLNEPKIVGPFIGPVLNLLNGLLPGKDEKLKIEEFETYFLKRIREKIDDVEELSVKKPSKKVLGFFKRMRDCYQNKKIGTEEKLNKEKIETLINLLSESKSKENAKTEVPPSQDDVKQTTSESNTVDVEQIKKELKDEKNKNKELRESKKKLENELEDFRLFYKQELKSWNDEKRKYEKQQEASKNSLNAKKLDIENLKVQSENLQKHVDELTDEIKRKNEELEDKNQSIRILKESRDDRFEKKMKSIHERLVKYYGQFQACQEMQMSVDLGLAMQNYLKNVFDIIIDNGIDLNQL